MTLDEAVMEKKIEIKLTAEQCRMAISDLEAKICEYKEKIRDIENVIRQMAYGLENMTATNTERSETY